MIAGGQVTEVAGVDGANVYVCPSTMLLALYLAEVVLWGVT